MKAGGMGLFTHATAKAAGTISFCYRQRFITMRITSFGVWLLVLVPFLNCVMTLEVLVLGGNGMLGSDAVFALLQQGVGCTLVNRGNWYWDSSDRIQPFVNHIQCDRTTDIGQTCPGLLERATKYDAVIDFTSYYPEDIEAVLTAMKGTIKKYIYISSDSVYEVCAPKTHTGFSKEDDAVRPNSKKEREELAMEDAYGDRKLSCEEVLASFSQRDGFDFISLRLPDVFGPRDNTRRWWPYYLWVFAATYMSRSIEIGPGALYSQISLVYSKDVANLIVDLLSMPASVFNQPYNLAFRSTQTLEEIIVAIANEMDIKNVSLHQTDDIKSTMGIPSVTRGPVDISKAIKQLKWNSTPFDHAVSETVAFYKDAMEEVKYRRELSLSLRRLNIETDEFMVIYSKRHGVDTKRMKDEL